jgi:GNAT superfamily N-acetyltransferase
MFESININIHQFFEHLKNAGFRQTFHKAFFINKAAIPVVKDLAETSSFRNSLEDQKYAFIEVTRETLSLNHYTYRIKSRFLKAKKNITKGYRAFAIVHDDLIIGDIWFVSRKASRHHRLHKDVDLLRLNPGPDDVYMFDMFIDPVERGKNIAVLLMGCSLARLRELGFLKAFGYFEAKNIPALWVHRTLKFTELNRVFISRYLFFRTSQAKTD